MDDTAAQLDVETHLLERGDVRVVVVRVIEFEEPGMDLTDVVELALELHGLAVPPEVLL